MNDGMEQGKRAKTRTNHEPRPLPGLVVRRPATDSNRDGVRRVSGRVADLGCGGLPGGATLPRGIGEGGGGAPAVDRRTAPGESAELTLSCASVAAHEAAGRGRSSAPVPAASAFVCTLREGALSQPEAQ